MAVAEQAIIDEGIVSISELHRLTPEQQKRYEHLNLYDIEKK